jgi:hypothetical protein
VSPTATIPDALTPVEDLEPVPHERPAPLPDGLQVAVIDQDDAMWDAAERFVYDLYRTLGFCEPDDRGWVSEHDAVRDGSRLVVAHDDTGTVAGTLRLVRGRFDELPAAACATGAWRPDDRSVVEFASLCTDPVWRGAGVVNELHRCAIVECVLGDAAGFVGAVEQWHGDHLAACYGIPVRWVGEGRHYMGSHTRAFVVYFDEMWPRMLRTHPEVYRWVHEPMPA